MRLLLLSILCLLYHFACGVILRGVTIKNPPYITNIGQNPDGTPRFEGYVVDLMDKIARIAGINYTLYLVRDGKYGDTGVSRPNGMIGELYHEHADFAVADLTVTDDRKEYVKFTESFMTLDLSALVRKDLISNISTLEELLQHKEFAFGALRSGSTYTDLHGTKDQLLGKIYYDLEHSFISVQTREEGVNRTLSSKFVFVQGSVANEYAMDRHCELTVVNSESRNYPREYAIALRRESLYLDSFNQAIRELKRDGTLDQLKNKYFRTKCLKGAALRSSLNLSVMFVGFIICFVSYFAN